MGNEQRISSPWPRLAARLDRAARRRDDVLHDREPEAGAARGARAVGAIEALEQARQVGLVDAGAVVGRRAARRRRRRSCTDSVALVPGPGVADRVLGEVPGDDAQHARPHLGARALVALDAERHTGTRRLLLELGSDLREHRQHRLGAQRDDPACPISSSARKSTSSISSRIWSTSARACSTSAGTSSPGSRRARAARAVARAACAARARRRR